MNRRFDNILSRISEPPLWWQAGGVPRYEPFDHHTSRGVYSKELALAEIATQCCETTSLTLIETESSDRRIAAAIRNGSLEYGDPPNVDCCSNASPYTSSETVKVLEYWATADRRYIENGAISDHAAYSRWVRDPSLEVKFKNASGSVSHIPPRGQRWTPTVRHVASKVRPRTHLMRKVRKQLSLAIIVVLFIVVLTSLLG